MRKDPLNPKYIKAEVLTPRVRIGPTVKEVISIEVVRQITEPEDNMEVIDKIIETTIFKGTLGDVEDKIVEENMGIIGMIIITEVGNRSRERTSSKNHGSNRERSSSNSRSRAGLELVQIEIG